MAKKADIGATIGIDGEKEFKKQISDINTDLKTLSSEMQVVTSEFIGNEKSTKALTAENAVLENSIEKLNDKLAVQSEMLRRTVEAYGSASPEAQKLQAEVNKTTAQINTMTAQVSQNNQQISSNSGLLGKLGINLNTVAQKFGLSSSSASKLTSVLGSAATAYAAVGAAVVKLVGNLNDLAIKQAEVVDNVNTMAMKYHTTTQAIDAFNYAARFTDVSTETMLGSLSKLTRSMDSARTGTGAAAEAFQSLGVAVTNQDGSLRSSHEVFMDVIDALRNVGNETERDAAAMDIFGKSAVELNGVIEAGSEGLRGYMEEAAKFGVVISDAANENLQDLQDVKDQTDAIAEAARTNAAAVWAPVAKVFEDIRGGFWLTVNDLATAIGGFGDESDDAAKTVRGFADANNELQGSLDGVSEALDGATEKTKLYITGVRDWTQEDARRSTAARLAELRNQAYEDAQSRGWDINWQAPGSMVEYNRMVQQAIQLDVTLDIDGHKLAQVTLDEFEAESQRRGPRATNNGSTYFANR